MEKSSIEEILLLKIVKFRMKRRFNSNLTFEYLSSINISEIIISERSQNIILLLIVINKKIYQVLFN